MEEIVGRQLSSADVEAEKKLIVWVKYLWAESWSKSKKSENI